MSNLLQTKSSAAAEQIIGREKELILISEALRRATPSQTFLLAVEGPAGIGKTSIVRHVLQRFPDRNCFKLYGKFEDHRENTPYSAFRQSFTLWAQQILLLPDEDFDTLKESTTSALQTNIGAVTEIFPELEAFFSRKRIIKSTHEVDPLQIKARFYYFLKKFFRSVTSLGYRLVIFLDDLQWADRASFLLLEELVQKNEIPGLLFVTTSRLQEESSSLQPEKMAALANQENVQFISLKAFTRNIVELMIPGEWEFSKQNRKEFSNYLWLESNGNPFRITEILKIIQRRKITPLKAEDAIFWENLPKLGNGKDSVEFMQDQINALPFHQLQVIASASCLGYTFSPRILCKILNLHPKEIRGHLKELIEIGFLIKKKDLYVFAHDTIYSAANSLLSKAEKCELHQRTGLDLLKGMKDYDQSEFFRGVNHLNRAHEYAGSSPVYSNEQVLLNIHAAKLAIRNTAFEIAHNYFVFAGRLFMEKNCAVKIQDPILLRLFETDEVTEDSLRFYIYYGYAETSFLLQKMDEALDFVNQALEINCSRHLRLQATLIKMMICSALVHQKNVSHVLRDGVNSLEQILAAYEIFIPADPEEIRRECAKNWRTLKKKTSAWDKDTDFPMLVNPDREYQSLINLVATAMTLLYYADPNKSLYLVSKTTLLTIDQGLAPVSPVLFSASFFADLNSEENRNLAHFLGNLSLEMIKKEPFKRFSYRVYYVASLNFLPWENHYSICVQKLEEGFQQAMEAGDPHYASFCQTVVRMLNTYRGKNLVKHMEDCAKMEKDHHVFFISGTDNAFTTYLLGEKRGFDKGNFKFPEEIIKESQYNPTVKYCLLLIQEKLYYLSGFIDKAISAAEECNEMENIGKGFELEHFFFYSLNVLQAAFLNPDQVPGALIKVAPKLREFKRLTLFESGNFLHKVFLIEAEMAKCEGDYEKATFLYDKTIKQAKQQGFVHHAAIAAERAAEYYRYKDRDKQAKYYLKKSLKYYTLWGSMAKVAQLKKNNASLLKERNKTFNSSFTASKYDSIRALLTKALPGKETRPEELGQYLLTVLSKESNARKGGILIFRNHGWKLLAGHGLRNKTLNSSLADLTKDLPVGMLNYCIKKGEKMILQDLFREGLFADDPYLKRQKPQNISFFPIKQSEETIGLIYLEDCFLRSEAEKNLFLVMVELASTTFANAVYYENNDILNRELKLQERNRIEAVVESQEKERQRIARELHDSLGQILALAKLNLSRINPDLYDTDNQLLLNRILELIDESCQEIRTISHNLMPPDLDNKNLAEILENLVNKNRLTSGIVYEFNSHVTLEELSVACKFTLYRILQEILQNIIKHAAATRVIIGISQSGDYINLLVEDNGKGFDTNLAHMGLGLKNIHSRIKLLNGYLDIDSSINNGTAFNVSIPVKSE